MSDVLKNISIKHTSIVSLPETLVNKYINIARRLSGCYVYVVGGAVRDLLMGKNPTDIDFVAIPINIPMSKATLGLHMVGKCYPIALIDKCEVSFANSLDEDLMRRDFTINSMYLDIPQNTLKATEKSLKDLNNRVLDCHGNIVNLIKADPVRLLRAFRFSAKYNLEISDNIHFDLYKVRNLIKSGSIPSDRLYQEISKGIMCGNGYSFVKYLDEYELLEFFFPSLYAVKGVDGAHYHNETVYTHCINALKALDPINLPFYLKMAALYHDVGKIKHEVTKEGKIRFSKHAALSQKLVRKDLGYSGNCRGIPHVEQTCIATLVGNHMNLIGGKKSLMKLLIKLGNGNVTLKDYIWLKYADSKANMKSCTNFMYFWRKYKDCLQIQNVKHVPSVKDLAVSGHDVMSELKIPQGRGVGIVLKSLWEMYLNGDISNDKDILLEEGLRIARKYDLQV